MAQVQHYSVGDYWIPQATFQVGGVNTDPTTITVKQQAPDGTETTLALAVATSGLNASSTPVAKTATGVYKLNPGILLASTGYWFAWFEGAGAVTATSQHEAIADPSEFSLDAGISARALVSLPVAKDWLNQQQISWDDDLDLVRVINDISDCFTEEAEREFRVFGTNPQTRTFAIEALSAEEPRYIDGEYFGDYNPRRRTVRVGDLSSYTQVQIIDDADWTTVLETVALSDISAHPMNRRPWEPIRELEFQTDVTALSVGMRVAVTGNWGFPSVPGNVRQAVLDAVAANVDRDVEHYRQELGVQPQGGEANVIVIGGGGQRLLSLPPSALAVAWYYRDPNLR